MKGLSRIFHGCFDLAIETTDIRIVLATPVTNGDKEILERTTNAMMDHGVHFVLRICTSHLVGAASELFSHRVQYLPFKGSMRFSEGNGSCLHIDRLTRVVGERQGVVLPSAAPV